MLVRAQAAAAHHLLRFRPSHHLHTRCVDQIIAVQHLPLARSAGCKCAAACNVGVATARAFVRHGFCMPISLKVLHQHADIATFAKKRMAVASFIRAVISAVDRVSVEACCAEDKNVLCIRHKVEMLACVEVAGAVLWRGDALLLATRARMRGKERSDG